MKRILGIGLLLALFSLPVFAAKNSHVFLMPDNVKVGDAQLPSGDCNVSWSQNGQQAQLTITTQDKKTVTVPVQVVQDKQDSFGVGTTVVNGVTYLKEVHTPNARYVIQDSPNVGK